MADPLAAWIESAFGLDRDPVTQRLVRRLPTTVPVAATELASITGAAPGVCAAAIRSTLQAGSLVEDPDTGRPVFAFRLHQFLSKATTSTSASRPKTIATSPAGTRPSCQANRGSC